MNRSLILALAATFSIACGTNGSSGDTGTGGDASDDTMQTADVQTADAETPAEAGGGDASARSFGTCGADLHACVCTCASMPAEMQQACQQTCLGASAPACQQCVGMAQFGCCPTEGAAVNTCAMTNNCMDGACINMNCATEIAAFQTCFNTAQTMMSCMDMVNTCIGSDRVCP